MTLSIIIGQNEHDLNHIKSIKTLVDSSPSDKDLKEWVNNIYTILTDIDQFKSDNIQIPSLSS